MDFWEAISKAQDAITVKRVYGEPYERDGSWSSPPRRSAAVVVGAVARTRVGAAPEAAGLGLAARPVGAYVIERGQVRWGARG